jgi:CP family cyanate transporter-like MFS transporter
MIATTLRVTFTGAAPLLDTIRHDYGLSTAQTGLLTTLPLLAFALISPLAAGLARRIGMERSLLSLLLICAGIGIRSLPSAALLFTGTAVIGCGIALGNVLLPGLIKRDFGPGRQVNRRLLADHGRSAGFCADCSAGTGRRRLARRVIHADYLPAGGLATLAAAVATHSCCHGDRCRALHNRAIWRSALAWQVTLFLGINSLIYYVIIGWLPAILQSHGYSETQAGSMHGVLQLATAVPGWPYR